MARVSINKVGLSGVHKDRAPSDLPYNAWSDSLNTRFKDLTVKSAIGHAEIHPGTAIPPFYLHNFILSGAANLIYAGANKIYSVRNGIHVNRTRQTAAVDVDYSATKGSWTGSSLGGVPILNNPNDLPQSYNFSTQKFENLPAWNSAHKCGGMRAFREFLIAFDITKGATHYPDMVKWSHPADPGTVPVSWDETDPTKDAGEYPLIDTGGMIVDVVPMRDFAIVYKSEAMYSMQFVGAPFIFKFNKLSFGAGLLSKNCVADVHNGHFVVTNEDILWHNGVEFKPIGPRRINDWVFKNLDKSQAESAFVSVDRREQKVWFCFPTQGHTSPNVALIWDWVSDVFVVTTVDNITHMLYGLTSYDPSVAGSWDAVTDAWDTSTFSWSQASSVSLGWDFIGCSADAQKIYSFTVGNTDDGVTRLSYIERTGLPIAGQDRDGTPILDLDSWKLFKAVWPKIKCTPGKSVDIYVGSQIVPEGAVTWSGPFPYNPQIDNKINCLVAGRFFCIKFQTEDDEAWELLGYDVDLELTGVY